MDALKEESYHFCGIIIIVEKFLLKLHRQSLCSRTFSDDITIIVQSIFSTTIRQRMQLVQNTASYWAITPIIIPFTNTRKPVKLRPLTIHDEELTVSGEGKYLKVKGDPHLSCGETHVW